MDIQKEAVEEFFSGHGVVGTASQVAGIERRCVKGVWIKADLANGNNVYVGHAESVGANGIVLDAGEDVFIPIDSLDKVWVYGGAASQGYSYIAV
jgi:hypothetical protein